MMNVTFMIIIICLSTENLFLNGMCNKNEKSDRGQCIVNETFKSTMKCNKTWEKKITCNQLNWISYHSK